jgi:hypothetical protein
LLSTSSTEPDVGRRAGRVLLLALAIGLLGQLLFFNVGLGINFPILIGAVLGAAWLSRSPNTPHPHRLDAWVPVAALGLSVFVAIRGDSSLVALDVLGTIGLTGGAVASFGGLAVVHRPFGRIVQLGGSVLGWTLLGASSSLGAAARTLPRGNVRSAMGRSAPIFRGLAIAIPLLLVFAFLFMAADAVFAKLVADLFDWQVDLSDPVQRLLLAVLLAWFGAGLLGFVALRDAARDPEMTPTFPHRRRVGATEAVVVLVVLDLLFAAFVIIQAAYLFGGADTLAASGMTYAEYARRGFFELMTVAFLVAGLIVSMEFLIATRTRAYQAAAIVLVALTLAVLGSSLLRLRLYQEAYGWTELRFYVLAAIIWLAIGAVATVVALATDRTKWLPHVMVVLSVLFGVAFNVIGPVRFIAEQNVARVIHPELVAPGGFSGLDVDYLSSLGTDADIVLAEAMPSLPEPERTETQAALDRSAADLAADTAGQAWQAWNLSREQARELLVE